VNPIQKQRINDLEQQVKYLIRRNKEITEQLMELSQVVAEQIKQNQ